MSEGRTVVVTGAGSGLGRATAERFAAGGDHVLLVGRTAEKLAGTAQGIAAAGAGVYQATVGFEGVSPPPVAATPSEPELIPIAENSVAVLR